MTALEVKPRRRLKVLAVFSSVLVLAGEPAWKNKPMSDWSADDSRQILGDSPWSKTVAAVIFPVPNEAQRRESGYMGERHGIGYDGVDERPLRTLKETLELIIKGKDPRPPAARSLNLQLRWETAKPVQAAERKTTYADQAKTPPTCPGEGYCIAVYAVPYARLNGNPQKLGNPFKGAAILRRQGRKDVKPSSVAVFEWEGALVLTYRFPPSAEITRRDRYVQFQAQIGRLGVAQVFDLESMVFEGRLEL